MTRVYLTCVECMNELTEAEMKAKLIAFGIHGKGIMCNRCYRLNTSDIVSDLLRSLRQ